ncbi:hypothetical protein CVT26_012461 [Gymnopilus dilepis]|uniref:Uncharacterized protein n=1 Tax=Gymnopilus dilepis TaxID=231916 RepID=A0A409YCU8_9AGAR|nr:hypothetical protein CVT26_012461 [Gymnopilus dilepis]
MQSTSLSTDAGPSNSGTLKYIVQTTDVLQDMRVNVSEEGSSTVIWYKHNPTSTILWTIHRPSSRGWYIRIRSPAFPPGVFIPLIPVPSTSPLHTDAALSFNTRTNVAPVLPTSESQFTLQDTDKDKDDATESDIGTERMSESSSSASTPSSTSGSVSSVASSSSSVHSYPPTPIATSPTSSRSPASYFDGVTPTKASFSKTHKRPMRPTSSLRPSSQITQFLLSPTSIPPSTHQPDPANMGFFARALSVLKSSRPSHSNSFTLSRVLTSSNGHSPSGTATPPPPYASNLSVATSTVNLTSQRAPELHTPLLVFHDQTPVYTVRSLTGLIELDKAEMTNLGVDPAFWITVALTYLEFLEEREVRSLTCFSYVHG